MELFGTAGIRGPVTRVTPELALAVGQAVGQEMPGERPTVVVGRDGRETGATLAAALEAGLTSAGADVVRVGQVPTPTLAYASRGRYGVMLTASHNPPPDNGIKLFADGQEFDSAAETKIERRVEAEDGAAPWDAWGATRRTEPLPGYRAAVVEYAGNYGGEPGGITIAVDCGNGMASLATPQVLRELGAGVRALHANVDGYFSARESKPTPETLSDLRAFVADGGAEFGLGHDGDADRIVVVDDDGDVVHEDTVVAILAAHYTRRCDADDPVVVTTPNASARIDERVRAAGGRVERVRLGALHEGIERVRKSGGPGTVVAFAAEPWKHIHPELGGWIDAVVSAAVFTQLVAASGLETLREPVTERPYRKESIACPEKSKAAVMDTLERTLPDAFPDATVETEYGIRLELPDSSWTLVRPSGTEPYIRIYAESEDVDTLVATAREYVEAAIE
ncbi:MAG: phosphomannomutase [Halovenus sp.]